MRAAPVEFGTDDSGDSPHCIENTEICILAAMKTTLDIHDALLIEAKTLAAQQRLSLTRLIEEGLRMRLGAAQGPGTKPRRAMPVCKPKGANPGKLNPDLTGLSSREMLDALDQGLSDVA